MVVTVKPKTTETGSPGIRGYRYRYRSSGSSATTYRYRTFSQNALPQGVAHGHKKQFFIISRRSYCAPLYDVESTWSWHEAMLSYFVSFEKKNIL